MQEIAKVVEQTDAPEETACRPNQTATPSWCSRILPGFGSRRVGWAWWCVQLSEYKSKRNKEMGGGKSRQRQSAQRRIEKNEKSKEGKGGKGSPKFKKERETKKCEET